ncbi:hypothetical protein BGZ46_002011 [Entomortierella lignicola]|nr:hypothetical protein BGZ46_002011 [Entomortierella lignicola]
MRRFSRQSESGRSTLQDMTIPEQDESEKSLNSESTETGQQPAAVAPIDKVPNSGEKEELNEEEELSQKNNQHPI